MPALSGFAATGELERRYSFRCEISPHAPSKVLPCLDIFTNYWQFIGMDGEPTSFLDRTISNLRDGWRAIAGSSYDLTTAMARPDLPDSDLETLRKQMQACLNNKGGEVSARAEAAKLGQVYLALDETGRKRFLSVLAREFDTEPAQVDAAIDAVQLADSDNDRRDAEYLLRKALEAPRSRLLTQFNALPDGVKFLVDMRAELLRFSKDDQALKALERDLRGILVSWFDVDLLQLKQISWDVTPATILEKLIEYEAVHAIAGWDDLKNRLDSDRRCFAFFHPRMPNEPLIFVEVALVNGIAGNVQELLDENAPVQNAAEANTAIFYSISNAQQGLAGISFGNFLIKRVVNELREEFDNLKTFSTLSPIPGFRKWLDGLFAAGDPKILLPAERKIIKEISDKRTGFKGAVKDMLQTRDWHRDPMIAEALKAPLMRLCARYLIEEKRREGRAADPVAHFHLSNGATIERLNWLGDSSDNGINQSAGMMVNYLYHLGKIEENHETYRAR
ncbi:MAG: malonyl-CoA decarboxylase, partial [Rhodospirillales bacterium]